jgi:hypothetical protein
VHVESPDERVGHLHHERAEALVEPEAEAIEADQSGHERPEHDDGQQEAGRARTRPLVRHARSLSPSLNMSHTAPHQTST